MNVAAATKQDHTIHVDRDESWRFIRAAKFAADHASTDNGRPILNAIEISITKDNPAMVQLVATDSYRLAVVECSFITQDSLDARDDVSVAVDAKQLASALPTKSKIHDFGLRLIIGPDGVTINNETTVHLPNVEGVYPNWKSLLTPWTENVRGHEAFAVNPQLMGKIMTSFHRVRDRSDNPVTILTGMSPLKPIGMELNLELLNVKSLLMPVRIAS